MEECSGRRDTHSHREDRGEPPRVRGDPNAELQKAQHAGEVFLPGCTLSRACRARIGRALRATLIVFGALAKQGAGYALSLEVAEARSGLEPARTVESMRLLKSLPRNVALCLNRLFGWSDPPRALAAGPGLTTAHE